MDKQREELIQQELAVMIAQLILENTTHKVDAHLQETKLKEMEGAKNG